MLTDLVFWGNGFSGSDLCSLLFRGAAGEIVVDYPDWPWLLMGWPLLVIRPVPRELVDGALSVALQ